LGGNLQPVRSAYQPPASSIFLSEQTSHQQPANSIFLSQQTSTSHQPPAKRTGLVCRPRMVNIVPNQLLDWICNEQRCVSWYTRMKSKKQKKTDACKLMHADAIEPIFAI
jgi:hypothetical protein